MSKHGHINRHGQGNHEKHLIAPQPQGTVRVESPGEYGTAEVSNIKASKAVKSKCPTINPLKSSW